MKINENIIIKGNQIILVPYNKYHVEKYHTWMQTQELQELTASEPLTLEQEYEMQASWRTDEDKCTFIILDKNIQEKTNNEIESMIGDTNLFLDKDDQCLAEIEIMIAEKSARKKGYGFEAISIMILFGIKYLKIKSYIAKIGEENEASIRLFRKLKFDEIDRNKIFREVTLKKDVSEDWTSYLNSICKIDICKNLTV